MSESSACCDQIRLLARLIGLVGRGTVLHTVAATLISFIFFALTFREMPYNTRSLNAVKLFSEFIVQFARPQHVNRVNVNVMFAGLVSSSCVWCCNQNEATNLQGRPFSVRATEFAS